MKSLRKALAPVSDEQPARGLPDASVVAELEWIEWPTGFEPVSPP